jgi:hypothetical protein
VNTLLQQMLTGVQKSTGDNHHGGSSVSGFNILGFGDFYKLLKDQKNCGGKFETIFAVGWMTEICLRIVAPSLVISTRPFPSWIILSMPLGPRLVLTTSANAMIHYF